MCDPITALTAISTVVGIKSATDAAKDRKKAAAEQKKISDRERRDADAETRSNRREGFRARRGALASSAIGGQPTPFSPRSFFAA